MLTNILIFIFIVIILIYFLKCNDSPDELYNKSIGIFDKPASLALDKLSSRMNKTTNDKLRIANIISESILEGEAPLRTQKRAMVKTAANTYINAFQTARDQANIETHLIETADNFNQRLGAEINIFELGAGAGADTDENRDFEINIDEFAFLFNTLDENVDITRKTHAAAVLNAEERNSKSIDESKIKYIEKIKTHISDPQNSHDSNVSREIRYTLDIISTDNEFNIDETLQDIKDYIRRADISTERKQKAQYSLQTLIDKNANISAANRSEKEIITMIWKRASHPQNADNEENIKLAVLDALIDISASNSYGESAVVCANGRVSRLIGALSALDFNENVGNLTTAEQKNNYILDLSAKIWKDHLASNPGEIADVLSGENKSADFAELEKSADYKEFMSKLREKVDQMLIENNADKGVRDKIYIGFDI
jgi:hypothetical protein